MKEYFLWSARYTDWTKSTQNCQANLKIWEQVQSKEDFLAAISKPINPDLAKLISKFDNYEESGKGVFTILRDYSPDVFGF